MSLLGRACDGPLPFTQQSAMLQVVEGPPPGPRGTGVHGWPVMDMEHA